MIWRGKIGRIASNDPVYIQLKSFHSNSPKSSSTPRPASNDGRVIFSGIQPTGVPHLGNYLGAIREWVRLQNNSGPETKLFFSIVDLHALTVPQNAGRLKKWRKEMFAALLAAGLDPRKSTVFYQSSVCDEILYSSLLVLIVLLCLLLQVPAHAELMWILSTVASMGHLSRMTQWKVSITVSLSVYIYSHSLDETPAP